MANLLSNFRNTVIVSTVLALIFLAIFAQQPSSLTANSGHLLGEVLFRWLHVFFGILWIGLLYYFNFVQIRIMPKIPAEQKGAVSGHIAPEALFWFRWAALFTVITGLIVAATRGYLVSALLLGSDTGFSDAGTIFIGIGMWLALIMAFNVWFIIWPNQQKALNIANAYPDLSHQYAALHSNAGRHGGPADDVGLSDLSDAVTARVQRVDPARTLAARLAPKAEADRLIGLYAFHYEIARVSEIVSDPVMGEIRLQWWREAIEEIRSGQKVRAHDAAQALEHALQATKRAFPFDLLIELIDARERDLDPAPFETIADLNIYAAATGGKLALAAAHLLAKSAIPQDQQKGLLRAGRAWALAGLARESALAKQFNARPRLPITPPAEDIAAAARTAYKEARELLKRAPADILPAFAYASLVPDLTNTFSVEAASPFGMRWRIFCVSFTGRI
jgi:phytoene/squalene synthetase